MPPELRDRRRAEIDADLWEFQHDFATARSLTPALQLLLRLVLGVPDDLAWCVEHVADADAAPGRTIMMTARAVGAALFIAVLVTIADDASRRRTGFVFDVPEAREGRQTLLMAGIVATVGPTMAATDEFEVASVKPNRSDTGLVRIAAGPGGRFTAVNVSLAMLIRNAYQRSDVEVSGGPDWIDRDRFDVVAKAPVDVPQDQIRLMLRSLLANRFGLRVHDETRELPIYALAMAKDDGRLGPQPCSRSCRNSWASSWIPGAARWRCW
jgi:hypothetical protein